MTLAEFKKLLDTLNLPVAYMFFKDKPKPPFIAYYIDDNTRFGADDINYLSTPIVSIEVYSLKKDVELETRIEKMFSENKLFYSKNGDIFIETDNIILTTYQVELIGGKLIYG
jgi:hypothetical protein